MKKNMGTTDRIVRIVVAIILSVLYFKGIVSGGLGVAALIVAAVMLFPAALGNCPLYTLFGIKTCKA